MANIEALTSKKVGGIPVLYIVLGVAVVALYGALKVKPSTPAATDTTTPQDTAGDLPDTNQPVFSATPTITQPSGVVTSVSATSGPDTDTLWSRRAIDYLRQNGFTLDVATSAINKYIAGEPLSATEASARDKAVAQFGLPPETVPDTSTIPADPVVTSDPTQLPTTPNYNGPSSKQGVPPTHHTVKGTSDNTFAELATLYYGHTGDGDINLIRSRNPSFSRSATLPVGTVVSIPRLVSPKYYKATSATHTAVAIASKNGTTVERVRDLNPTVSFPVRVGTSVRVQ
jgi:LysM repeat protein